MISEKRLLPDSVIYDHIESSFPIGWNDNISSKASQRPRQVYTEDQEGIQWVVWLIRIICHVHYNKPEAGVVVVVVVRRRSIIQIRLSRHKCMHRHEKKKIF
jgi:hypothetical protein